MIQTVTGVSVEIFCEVKNTARPLTVWIVGTDMERRLFSTQVCAILANGNSVNYGRQFCLELPVPWNKILWKDNPIQKWILKGFLVYGN